MKKKEYIAPEAEVIACMHESMMDKASYTIDDNQEPIVEDDPDIVFGKGNDGLDDSWDMWNN